MIYMHRQSRSLPAPSHVQLLQLRQDVLSRVSSLCSEVHLLQRCLRQIDARLPHLRPTVHCPAQEKHKLKKCFNFGGFEPQTLGQASESEIEKEARKPKRKSFNFNHVLEGQERQSNQQQPRNSRKHSNRFNFSSLNFEDVCKQTTDLPTKTEPVLCSKQPKQVCNFSSDVSTNVYVRKVRQKGAQTNMTRKKLLQDGRIEKQEDRRRVNASQAGQVVKVNPVVSWCGMMLNRLWQAWVNKAHQVYNYICKQLQQAVFRQNIMKQYRRQFFSNQRAPLSQGFGCQTQIKTQKPLNLCPKLPWGCLPRTDNSIYWQPWTPDCHLNR